MSMRDNNSSRQETSLIQSEDSITVHVPVQNIFTEQTVDYMRQKKAEVLEAEIKHGRLEN